MTTMFYIAGYCSFHNTAPIQPFLGGPATLLQQLGDTSTPNVVPIAYSDWDILGGAQDGANQLAAKINALPAGEKAVVVAHSYGAVAAAVLTNNPSQIKHDPALLTFVNMGNSLRLNNGYWTLNGAPYGKPGPVSTTHKIIDIVRQFDRYGDVPNVTTSPYYWQAENNMNAGDSQIPSIHLAYDKIRLDQPHTETTIGTVRFLLYETDPMPNPSGLTRAQIESAYNRVITPNW